jgi:hypothetical protein
VPLTAARSNALIVTGHNLVAMLALGKLCRGRRLLRCPMWGIIGRID